MGKIEWGAEPELFGPRHAHREGRILRALQAVAGQPGLHLECAAGVGSLTVSLARAGCTVVAADTSLPSLVVLGRRTKSERVLPVVADITRLPFSTATFASASSAETLEHVPDHQAAAAELARVLRAGAWLVGTVPAACGQWAEWDSWAGHLRRFDRRSMFQLLDQAGLEPRVTVWGWPMLRLYDALFLNRLNRRRLSGQGLAADRTLQAVSGLGRRRWLVRLVQTIFACDRLFDRAPWGVGLLFEARKPNPNQVPTSTSGLSEDP